MEEGNPTIPLYFDFYIDEAEKQEVGTSEEFPLLGKNVIHIPDLHTYSETPYEILEQLIKRFNIPPKYHFPLFARIRLVKAFPSTELRTQFVLIRLLSFSIMGMV